MFVRVALAGALMAVIAAKAEAADFDLPAVYDWTGLYIGAHAGYGEAEIGYQLNADDIFSNQDGQTVSRTLDGLVGGGYNWQIDKFVLGLEGSFTWAGFDHQAVIDSGIGNNPVFHSDMDWIAALTPRLGVAFDNVLIYGKGGLALADLGTRIEQQALAGQRFTEDDATEFGWTIGAGAEVALVGKWMVGVEVDYYDFGTYTADKNVTNPPDPPRPGTDYDVDASLWNILERISYKFQ
jgi:outer membrane immunogenic protein